MVGLGCVGCSTAYYCSKNGLKVLGIERNAISGDIGTSSAGFTRVFRLHDSNPVKNEMMETSLELWKQAEEELKQIKYNPIDNYEAELQTELLSFSDLLMYGSPDAEFIKKLDRTNPALKWLTSAEIMEQYPTLENLGSDWIGAVTTDAGQVRVKHALEGFSYLAKKHGATLLYDTEVSKVSKSQIETADGKVYKSKNVLVC